MIHAVAMNRVPYRARLAQSVEDWRSILGSRLRKEGNEPEVREAYALACTLLHERFPHVIPLPATLGYEP